MIEKVNQAQELIKKIDDAVKNTKLLPATKDQRLAMLSGLSVDGVYIKDVHSVPIHHREQVRCFSEKTEFLPVHESMINRIIEKLNRANEFWLSQTGPIR